MVTITYKPRVFYFKALKSGTPFVRESDANGPEETPCFLKLAFPAAGYTAVDLTSGSLENFEDDVRVIPFSGEMTMYPYRV